MDDIWKNAARKARARDKRAATRPIANTAVNTGTTTATTTTSLAAATDNPATPSALTEEDMNTVEKVDAKLARMEEYWAESRSEPFPEGVRNAIAALRASLEKRDTETTPASELSDLTVDVRHVTTTITTTTIPAPADTTALAIFKPTTTSEHLGLEADEHNGIATSAGSPTQLEHKMATTTTNSNMVIEQQNDEESAVGREEEQERRAGKRERVREQEAERQEESDTGEREGIEERQSGIKDPIAVSADHTAHGTTVHELQQFNWARDVDDPLGLSPADPDLGDATPEPTLVNPDPGEIVAIHAEFAGVTPAPVGPNLVTPDNPTPTAFTKRSPIISVSPIPPIAYEPRDFSALRSGKQNPWGSLNHRRRRPYAHPHVTNSRLEAPNHSNLLPPHPRHSVSSVSSLRHSFNTQSNPYLHQPLAPVNIIQTTPTARQATLGWRMSSSVGRILLPDQDKSSVFKVSLSMSTLSIRDSNHNLFYKYFNRSLLVL